MIDIRNLKPAQIQSMLDAALLEQERRKYRSLLAFVEDAWAILEPGEEYKGNWHINAICQHLEAVTAGTIKNLLINVPPGTGKSIFVSVLWPAWEWAHNPALRYFTVSYSEDLTIRDNLRVRDLISSAWYQRLWPNVALKRDENQKTKFALTGGGWRIATSIGGRGTGEHPDRKICLPHWETVWTDAGLLKIGEIVSKRIQVNVLSLDTRSGKLEYKPISDWIKNPASRLVRIDLSNGAKVTVTPDHEIWTPFGWVKAANLSVGDFAAVIEGRNSIGCPSPIALVPDVGDRTSGYIKHGGERGSAFFRFADVFRIISRNFNAAFLWEWVSVVPNTICDIVRPRSVGEIVQPWIHRVAIKMANIVPHWTRANKHNGNESVDMDISCLPICSQGDSGIPVAWRCLENPSWNSYAISNSWDASNQAVDGNFVIRKSFNCSPKFVKIVSVTDAGTADNTYCLTVQDNHSMCCGTGVIISNCDDAHNVKQAESDAERQNALSYFDRTLSSRGASRNAATIVVMQRLHEKDLSGHIMSQSDYGDDWAHLCIPMEYEGNRSKTPLSFSDPRTVNGDLLWPSLYPRAVVKTLAMRLGEYGSAGQLQQRPSPAGGGILRTEHFQQWPSTLPLPDLEFVLQSYDTAFTDDDRNDPTACTVWGIFTHKKRKCALLLDAWDEHISYPDLRPKLMADWGAKYGGVNGDDHHPARRADILLIEEKASGIALVRDLRRAGVPVATYNPGRASKELRAHLSAPILEMDVIYILESKKDPGMFITWARAFIKQCEQFPNSEHKDLVDSFTQAMIYLKDTDMLVLPEIPLDEPDEIDYDEKRRVIKNPYSQ